MLGLTGLLLCAIVFFLALDTIQTRYLSIDPADETFGNSYLIQQANVLPMDQDTILSNQSVRVENGRITAIGELSPRSGERILNAQGAYLLPGLVDMHVHVWDRYELGLYLAHGVTTVRNLWGHPMHLRMKADINEEKILSPDLYTSGPKLTGPEFIGDDNLQLHTPAEAREKVNSYHDRGYDFIKTYYGLTPDLYDAVIETCRKLAMDIVAHPSQQVPYAYHFDPQIRTIEHAEDIVQLGLNYQLDTAKLQEIVSLYAEHPQQALCPTMTVYHNIYRMIHEPDLMEDATINYLNPLIRMVDSQAQLDRWTQAQAADPDTEQRIYDQHRFHLFILQQLHQAGGTIVCGTDAGIGVTPPGASIHDELAFYQEAGLSHFEVLKTATANPATMHNFLTDIGTIQPGKKANLLLVKDNPLENLEALRDPSWVMVRGRVINKDKLEIMKTRESKRNNLLVTALRYAENLWVER